MNVLRALASLVCFVGVSSQVVFSQAQSPTAAAAAMNAQVSSIESVIGQVKQAIAEVQTTLAGSGLPPLKQVKLSLQTVATKKGGVTLKLWVINFGGTIEKDKTQQIDIVLTPPPAGTAAPVGAVSLTEELQEAIVNAAKGVQDAGKGAVPLRFTSLDVQLGFTVKGDLSGGAAITIVPITLDFTGDLSKTAVQTLTVSFATPTPSPTPK
jgi:hypothetical protein